MLCKKCGKEIDNSLTTCPFCGAEIQDSDKIQITYEDEATEYVEPPVIMEAHTFIADEDFAKKIHEQTNTNLVIKNGQEIVEDEYDLESEEDHKSPLVYIFIVFLLAVIGAIFVFAILPNIMVSKPKSKGTSTISNTFTSEEWTSKEFMIDGVLYKLNKEYSNFANQGWSYSIEDEKKVEAGEKTSFDIRLTSSDYKNEYLEVGFYNASTRTTTVKDCRVYSVLVNNYESDKPIDFELPGGIRTGSGSLEITSLYGKLGEDQITIDDVGGFSVYHYTSGSLSLDLTIYDQGGLQAFHYMDN